MRVPLCWLFSLVLFRLTTSTAPVLKKFDLRCARDNSPVVTYDGLCNSHRMEEPAVCCEEEILGAVGVDGVVSFWDQHTGKISCFELFMRFTWCSTGMRLLRTSLAHWTEEVEREGEETGEKDTSVKSFNFFCLPHHSSKKLETTCLTQHDHFYRYL